MYPRSNLFPINGAPAVLFPRALPKSTRERLARARAFTYDDAVLFAASVANDAFDSPFTPRDVLRALAEAILEKKCAQGCVVCISCFVLISGKVGVCAHVSAPAPLCAYSVASCTLPTD